MEILGVTGAERPGAGQSRSTGGEVPKLPWITVPSHMDQVCLCPKISSCSTLCLFGIFDSILTGYVTGKSAPRLVSDLLDHDPRFSGRNGRNLLTDPAPIFRGIQILRKGPHECRHILMSKAAQSSPPASDDEKPDLETKYVVAAFCSNCRYHFVITVDFTQGRRGQVPCKLSDGENPMHHLRLAASKKHAAEGKYSLEAESYRFVCSGASCPVTLDIVVSPPRLPPILFSSILDATELEARGRRVIAGEPERYVGLDPLTPMQVFSNMRQYLTDAKTAPAQGEPRRIARRNKKYFLAFADECDDLFKYLDFKAVTDEPTESPKVSIRIPILSFYCPKLTWIRQNPVISGSYHK